MPENSAKRAKGPKSALSHSPRGLGQELFLADFWCRWRRDKSGGWHAVEASRETVLGHEISRAFTWSMLVSWLSQGDRQRFVEAFEQVTVGATHRLEVRMGDRNGEEHWVRMAIAKFARRGSEEATLGFVVLGPSRSLRAAPEPDILAFDDVNLREQLRNRVALVLSRLRQAVGGECTLGLTGDWAELAEELGFPRRRSDPPMLALLEPAASRKGGEQAVAIALAGRVGAWLQFPGRSPLDRWEPHLERTLEEAREELRVALAEFWLLQRRTQWIGMQELLGAACRTLFVDTNRGDPLRELCRVVANVFGGSRAHLWFAEPPNGVYHLVAHWGFDREEIEALQVLELAGPFQEGQGRGPSLQLPRLPSEFSTGDAAQPRALRLETGGVLVVEWAERAKIPRLDEAVVETVRLVASLWFFCTRLSVELDQAIRVKSDFVATMSHELRTPLNTLMGYTDLLACEEFGPLTEEQRDVLDRMNHSARELLDLINATLDWGRFQTAPAVLDVATFSLPDLIAELDRETSYQRRRRGLEFVSEVDAAVRMVRTDRSKLKVILKNLLTNAVKFTEHGSIEVRACAVENGVEIAVRDTGIGIDASVLPVIFEPFRQGEPAATRRFGGVGLGLYVVRRLVEIIGGTVSVDSQPGKGSEFRVWVPAVPPASTS